MDMFQEFAESEKQVFEHIFVDLSSIFIALRKIFKRHISLSISFFHGV